MMRMVVCLLFALVACMDSSSSTDTTSVAGNWHGTISDSCTYTATFTQTDDQVDGTYSYTCPSGAGGTAFMMSGTLTEQSLALSVDAPCGTVNLNADRDRRQLHGHLGRRRVVRGLRWLRKRRR